MICTNIHYVCAIFICIVDSFSKAFSFIYEGSLSYRGVIDQSRVFASLPRVFPFDSRVFISLPRVSSLDSRVFSLICIKKLGSLRVMPSFDFAIGLNGCPAAVDYELCACHKAGFV